MRILSIGSEVAVLITTLAFGHLLHHYFINASSSDVRSPVFLASFAAALGVAVLSVIGGFLLLKRSR